MIEQELLFLGLLREGPKHGYEIKTSIRKFLSIFAGVDLKSIYYPLAVLEKKGLIVKRSLKPGKRPQRIVYALTPKGRARFSNLLEKSLITLKRPQFSLDLSLYFLRYLKPSSARRRLRARLRILHRISLGLAQVPKAGISRKYASLAPILEHNLKMLEAESGFILSLINNLKKAGL